MFFDVDAHVILLILGYGYYEQFIRDNIREWPGRAELIVDGD